MTHRNASLTPRGRRQLAHLVVDEGWSYRRAAERFQVAPATARKWAERYRAGASMADQSSRPRTSPTRKPAAEDQIRETIRPVGFPSDWLSLQIPRSKLSGSCIAIRCRC